MISNAPLTVILPVADMSRATTFYRDQLGMADAGDEPGGNRLLKSGSGATIALMAAEDGAQSSHTVLSFEVDDIGTEINELSERGVTFLDYNLPELKPPTMRASSDRRRPPGSPTPKETSSASTR